MSATYNPAVFAPDAAEEFVHDGAPVAKAYKQGRLPLNRFLTNMFRPSVGRIELPPHEFCRQDDVFAYGETRVR